MNKKKTSILITALLLFFILDRITKYLILNELPSQGVYFNRFFSLDIITNTGIAFGIQLPQILIISLISIITIFLVSTFIDYLQRKKYLLSFLIGFIIIGALSNLLDRVLYGSVIDFIQIMKWPNFNLADTYISVSIIIYTILLLKKKK